MIPLVSTVEMTPITVAVAQAFDVPFNGQSFFTPHEKPIVGDFSLGAIVGGSGTGKSILLREFGMAEKPTWDSKQAIAAHFSSAEEAMLRLSAAGINSIPDWVKPYHVLSTGQQFRADLARCLVSGACIDEFTSTVDRDTAKAASAAVARYVRKQGLRGVVLASCHRDILDWLEPDWVFDTDNGMLITDRRFLRPRIEVELVEGGRKLWPRFAPHHYLSATVNDSARIYTLWWGQRCVGFYAIVTMPGRIQHAWRGHRSVILPEFQGFGLGGRMAEAVGELVLSQGKRFFTRTAHPWVGRHRDASLLWRKCSTSRKQRTTWKERPDSKQAWWALDAQRVCWSHEYVGHNPIDFHSQKICTSEEIEDMKKAPPPRKVPTELRGSLGGQIVARIKNGEDVTPIAKEYGLRRSSIYRLLQWKSVDLKALKKRRSN